MSKRSHAVRWAGLYVVLVGAYTVALALVPAHVLGYLLALAASAAWVLFVVAYGLFAPWWTAPVSRNYLGLAVVIAATMTFVAARLTFAGPLTPDAEADRWRVVIYSGVLVFGVRHLFDFIRGQLRGRAARLARGE